MRKSLGPSDDKYLGDVMMVAWLSKIVVNNLCYKIVKMDQRTLTIGGSITEQLTSCLTVKLI